MVKIAIVDDDSDMTKLIKECMTDVVEDVSVETEVFQSAEEFLQNQVLAKEYDILLADIELPNMNGMELGKTVRKRWPDMRLVFLTSHSEYAIESYNIDADQYVLKSNMGSRLWKVMRRLIQECGRNKGNYRVIEVLESNEPKSKIIYYNEIIYISKVKGTKYIEYTTTTSRFRERITMENIMKELPGDDFIMVERSYIVNIKHIIKMSSNVIYLRGEHCVTVSRAHFPRVKQKIHDYGRRK
ncbi:MAG: response regulator transcription factor [Dorea sp.]|nr:response regulator transcription factor [Dorea sp.]